MGHSKRNLRVRVTTRGLAVLVAGLWLFSFGCLNSQTAQASFANPYEHNYYLVGVDKILVWVSQPLSDETSVDETGRQHKIPKIDFVALNQSAADQVRAALPINMKNIPVETISNSSMHSGMPNIDEKALIVRFIFGYHVARLGDRYILLGAISPSVDRRLPAELSQPTVHGMLFSPEPFLMEGDEAAINTSISKAMQRCVTSVDMWFRFMPSQTKAGDKRK